MAKHVSVTQRAGNFLNSWGTRCFSRTLLHAVGY